MVNGLTRHPTRANFTFTGEFLSVSSVLELLTIRRVNGELHRKFSMLQSMQLGIGMGLFAIAAILSQLKQLILKRCLRNNKRI